ncbi:MAG: outer membrane protein assembly factor BamD (BamD/ComL family) [Saprospiraceae bacterium]|jgi:outer membrane protein assembly factor BamD (BamD/ComL family)
MTNFLKISTLTLLTITIWVISGCTTQKVKGEYTGLKKVYHNTTQRYNGYFNATVLMEESELSLTQQYVDNYNKILPIFPYTKADNPQAMAESLDEAMKKVSVAVNLHRGANWTDDCYLLLGQAQYLKQDYETAEETFEFMEVEFSNDLKKRGSLSKRARDREAKSKADKEAYKKERIKEMKEERELRDESRADAKKTKAKEAKAKKKSRDKARKAKMKADKAYKKAREQARKKGLKAPPRPGSKTTEKKDEDKTVSTEKKEEEKKEDKEEEKTAEKKPDMLQEPESYFLKHRPAYREGILWLARTYIERDNWTLANNKLTQLENDSKISKDVAAQLPIIRAYYFTEQKQYAEAIPHLEKAIELEDDRMNKARYAYIIAQINAKAGNLTEALAGYERALKFRPGYTMEFSAQLNILNSKYSNGITTAEAATKELNRLLKDIKNEEYQDQIYYTLAQVAFGEKQDDEAIAYLESSLSVPTSNKANQAEAFYKLANVYLQREDYVNAKSYFDSTIGILPKSDERYEEAETFAKNLTAIAENLQEIELQDSLIRLSKLTDEERRTRAFDIKKAENEKRRQIILDKANGKSGVAKNNITPGRAGSKASSFFAYDDRSVKKGAREFVREWGERPLKDNWRLGEEEISDTDIDEELESLAETVITDEDVEKLFKDVPDTPEKTAAAEKKIEEAMFNLGRLYRDKLGYNEKTVKTLDGLLKRNPKTEYEPDALYYLYLAHTDLGNTRQANEAKNKLLNDYAETTFARVIKDPDYVKNVLDQDYQLNKYYDETYSDFKNGQYKAVEAKLKSVPSKFGVQNTLAPRFALLNAMTIGNLQGKEAYINALKDVVAKFPKEPEQVRAKEILRLLGVKGSSSAVNTGGGANGVYSYEEDKLHYMIVVFDDSEISLTDAKVKVSDYHSKYHKLDKLRISNIYLGGGEEKIPLIVVRRFKDKVKAMEYFDGVEKNKGDYVPGGGYKVYPVTQNNYRQILKSKTLAGYESFFEENYK